MIEYGRYPGDIDVGTEGNHNGGKQRDGGVTQVMFVPSQSEVVWQ